MPLPGSDMKYAVVVNGDKDKELRHRERSIAQQFTKMPEKNIVNKRCQQKQSNLDVFFKT